MPLFQWTDELSVGVQSMDKEHKYLVDLINRLHDAMAQGKAKDVSGSILSELVRYTQTHFTHEEDLMTRTAYPQLSVQKLQHSQFVKKVQEMQNQLAQGTMTLSLEMMNFLKNWLKEHIMKMDKAYSQHFASRGIR